MKINLMSKAILVIDMPESCEKCPCFQGYDILNAYCGKVEKIIPFEEENGFAKPDWCPLKELPEKEFNNLYLDEYSDGYDDGWNACLDKISKNE